jgi:hypothetical protein
MSKPYKKINLLWFYLGILTTVFLLVVLVRIIEKAIRY